MAHLHLVWAVSALVIGCAGTGMARAAPGVSASEIVVGMSAPLSGSLAPQGQALRDGVNAAFAAVNADGGIHGRKLQLRVRDDGGEAGRAAAAVRGLLADEGGVVALTGFVGAAMLQAVAPLIEADPTPFVGLATSFEPASALAARPLFRTRAGVPEQIAAVLSHTEHVGIDKIALVTQAGAPGQEAWDSLHAQLVQAAMRPAAAVRLASGDGAAPALAGMVRALRESGAGAVLLALEGPQALAVVGAMRTTAWMPSIYLMHEAWATLAAQGHAKELAGTAVVLALPNPEQSSNRLVAEFRRHAALLGTAPSTAGLEGYLTGRLLIDALQRCPREPVRACLVDDLNARVHDLAGHRLQFNATTRRGSRWTELTLVRSDGTLQR